MSLNLEQAREESRKAWDGIHGCARVKCPNCFENWRDKGSQEGDKPPFWPPDYQFKPCPTCGKTMSASQIPF